MIVNNIVLDSVPIYITGFLRDILSVSQPERGVDNAKPKNTSDTKKVTVFGLYRGYWVNKKYGAQTPAKAVTGTKARPE